MPRQIGDVEDSIHGKIRKRGCSPSASSSSSIIQNYRLKKAVLVGKRGGSSTPVPTWRLMSSRSPSAALRGTDSPKYAASLSGKSKVQAPVSARKLAATLWEMNEMPSPRLNDGLVERRLKKESKGRDKIPRSVHSGPLPPHLSDPSHSPVSERTDRLGIGSHRRTPSISHKLRLPEESARVSGSLSNASLMEVETRSRTQTPCRSTLGGKTKTRLKDVSNALTTSKELLKIINRIWGNEDRPSSNMSLISALHTELERSRLLVNQLIQEQRSDQNEISYLVKCFAEEKAVWKTKEREVVEAAIESVVGELEVERKLRRRFESLNKKLGRELADAKSCLVKTVKELESEKRAREIIEQVCDELAADIEEDKEKVVEDLKREKLHEAVSEAKNVQNEKNAAIDALKRQLEAFLGTKKVKEKGSGLYNYVNDEEVADYFNRVHGTHYGEEEEEEDEEEEDTGEVVDKIEYRERSVDSDLHSIELEMDNSSKKSFKWGHGHATIHDPRKDHHHHHHNLDEEVKGRKSTLEKVFSRTSSLQRSISDGVEWGSTQNQLDWEKGHLDELQGYKSGKGGLMERLLLGTLGSPRAFASPTRPPRASRDSAPGSSGKSRLADARSEIMIRKSKR